MTDASGIFSFLLRGAKLNMPIPTVLSELSNKKNARVNLQWTESAVVQRLF